MSALSADGDNSLERAGRRLDARYLKGRFAMMWFFALTVALGMGDKGEAEATDWMKPATFQGNFWGPAATRARATGRFRPFRRTR